MQETEVKLKVTDFGGVRDRLNALGADLEDERDEERDLMFHPVRDWGTLEGEVLRLRLRGNAGLLTWKGKPRFERGVKSRDEVQTEVRNPSAMRTILERLGYEVSLDFAKRREYWRLRGLSVSLDELPFGRFVEIEGDEAAIEQAVRDLGLVDAERAQQSYAEMASEYMGGSPD